MFETWPALIGAAFVALVAAFALLKGGAPERIGCSAFLLGWLASLIVQTRMDFAGVQWLMFALDVTMLVIFGSMVWKAPRSWPVWACALQLLAVTSHVMVMLHLKPTISAFYTVVNLTGYGIMLSIAIGTFWAWQERKVAEMSDFESDRIIR